jgi:transcriptional regulator with XRE-family HTH domain
MSENLSLGERIAWYRRRRGMSQEVLAGLVGRTTDWLSKIENGRIELDRLSVIKALADALDVQLADLIGEPSLMDWTPDIQGRTVPVLREALMNYRQITPLLGPLNADDVPDLSTLRADVADAWTYYQQSQYAKATRHLPGLLAQAHVAAQEYQGDDQLTAHALLAMTYQGAAMVLAKVGEQDLAWIAAERGLTAAQASGDPIITGSLFRSLAHCLLSNGKYEPAVQLVRSAADYLEPGLTDATHAYLSVYGTLFLAGSVAAARAQDRDTTRDFINEADHAARILGQDANHMWTAFGPTNVAIHRVGAAMEFGDVQIALDQGPHIDARALPVERQVRHTLEMARAYHIHNQRDDALSAVLDAERLAPEQVRYHFIARQLVTTWVRSARARPSYTLTSLARRLRIID